MESAVIIRDAYKSYGRSSHVLKGLGMEVPQGAIYGLLGPSGCGKTTLLSCIVGRVQLDAGVIQTTAKSRADVGYMPQEVALASTMTILETLLYYGRLYGLSKVQVYERLDQLSRLLELKPPDTFIKEMSGGQQRRVSLAITMLHDPQLLILDEPTVGLDPILSDSIWKYLLQLATREGKSIIITTHYIEEARQAHVIGLMRGGVLLAQASPTQLMTSNGCDTLEEVFLKMSNQQEIQGPPSAVENPPSQSPAQRSPLHSSELFAVPRFFAQLTKNMYSMRRNIPMTLFVVGLPIMQCLLYCTAIGRDPGNLRVAVVDQELEDGLSACLNIARASCNFSLPLSCRFINQMKSQEFQLVGVGSVAEAEEMVQTKRAWGTVHFPHNYTAALAVRLEDSLESSDQVVGLSMVSVRLDMSNYIVGTVMKKKFLDSYVDFLEDLYKDCGWSVGAAGYPIKFQEPVYGVREPDYRHFTAPGIIVLFEFYLAMIFTVGAMGDERQSGTLERNLVAGLTALEIVLAHSVVQFLLILLQTWTMHFILFNIFSAPYIGDMYWTTLLLVMQGILGMFYGFFMFVITRTSSEASLIGMGTVFPLFMTCGTLWPVEGMHSILQLVGVLLPLTPCVESVRGLTARGWDISHPVVFLGYLSTVGWIIFFALASAVTIKVKKGVTVH